MLATLSDRVFSDPAYIYEIKWDGYRMISHVLGKSVKMYSRNGKSFKNKFGELVPQLMQLPEKIIIDGEVVVTDKDGRANFEKLQNYNSNNRTGILVYYVFDILMLDGYSTLELPLLERKSLLKEILPDLPQIKYSEHIEKEGELFFEEATENGLEGIMAKKADSIYRPGIRTKNWLKMKTTKSKQALICGYTESSKSSEPFASLILGEKRKGKLEYIGNCGTGFSRDEQRMLLRRFEPVKRDTSPFSKEPQLRSKNIVWLEPEWECEVEYSEETKSGKLRHPSYKGLVSEKDTELDVLSHHDDVKPSEKDKKNKLEISGIPVKLTHLNKVYWPGTDLKKYDLINYYLNISEYIMPYLKDRPHNLHRHPNGIEEKGFYQKDLENHPDWVETIGIFSESTNKEINYLVCKNEATLIYMANLGCIEINPWNCRVNNLENPDYGVIDIDPSDENTFAEVLTTAGVAKQVIDEAGIEAYAKTTGKSGLHIYIPMGAKYSHEDCRDFIKLLCYFIHKKLPDLTSMERSLKKRKGKIYLDYLQNRSAQTLAAVYCVRPVENAQVSAPVNWKEIEKGIEPSDFTLHNMLDRIEDIGDIFSPVLGKAIDISKAINLLEKKYNHE